MSEDLLTGTKRLSRRGFFSAIAWGAFTAYMLALGAVLTRFFYPKILYEPSQKFRAGVPDDYPKGIVNESLKKAQRVWMIHTEKGIYSLIAICTHLGCTPNWFLENNRFQCPCHGSNFTLEGDVIAGPAPQPLFRAKITLAADGKIQVDKAITANRPPQRDEAPFVLKV
ncbi:MAG: ubiquinol-cytochrome c reductase iron-sulfur subunit [Candidatus Tectomicrobia bacterium]|nr:ubiquinol-cytochrome c reductase iron-sulfur subunit [Candidatus Tectomicrobia bacterium]